MFEMGFDGERFVPVIHGEPFAAANRYVLVSDATELMQDSRLYNALVSVSVTGLRVASATLVQGVPGCGKSEHIIRNSASEDLILTSTMDAAADMRRRLERVGRGKTLVKTVDSCIINIRGRYRCVWVDEARMCHAGKMVAIMHIVEAERIFLLGDVAQIPYICRVPQVTPKFHLVENLVAPESIEYRSISYRIPVSIAARISRFYPHGGCRSVNVGADVCESILIDNLNEVPKISTAKYLTFKQSEKQEVQLYLRGVGSTVSTVNEFQGSSATHIIVVRLSARPQNRRYFSSYEGFAVLHPCCD